MKKEFYTIAAMLVFIQTAFAQTLNYKNQIFEVSAVKTSVVTLNGEEVIKVERDLNVIPFDVQNLVATVDEPTYVKLKDCDFANGVIEVKMLSQIQEPSPFQSAQGFIGIAFRINADNSAFEAIYLRPKVGRSDNQLFRNHTVQYFAYPGYKFDRLREEAPGKYETSAPVNINEWITMRIEVDGEKAEMFINGSKYSTFIVDKMKGKTTRGTVGLWVDIGTIGYFKDLKVTKK